MSKLNLIYLVFVILPIVDQSVGQLSCMDENNKPVDWFIAMKYPDSYDFVYLTPTSSQWQSSASNLSCSSNMVALTLEQSYDNRFFNAYYNDEKPKVTYSVRGHLKGVLNFGASSGYWLIHSVPKFPQVGSYYYNEGETIFAQSFICVTVSTQSLPPIVGQLLMMKSTVYGYNIPDNFSPDATLMANLAKLVKNKNVMTQPSKVISLKTRQLLAVHLGKGASFRQDLYAALIAPTLKTSLYVESWIRGDRVDSSCDSQYKVYNVEKVALVDKVFKESRDHSKWAVSTSAANPFVCIGDINRMTSQFKRGGGSLCISNLKIWTIFNKLVADYEECPSTL